MRFKVNDFNASPIGNSIIVNMIIPRTFFQAVQSLLDAFKRANKNVDFEISIYKEKRSLSANNYFWKLADELAKKLHSTKEEVYREAISHVGVFYELSFKETKAIEEFERIWKSNGTGWIVVPLDECTVHAYKGSSKYRTDEMSRLIDYIQTECKAQGIEVRPQEEVEALLKQWRGGK